MGAVRAPSRCTRISRTSRLVAASLPLVAALVAVVGNAALRAAALTDTPTLH
ncbi:hypothetical protein CLOM_g5573, partial [Closterium sp. NIES-68]